MAQKKATAKNQGVFRFSFGPWNIHEGADPFGPPVRQPFTWDEKISMYRKLGFEGVQFHDDDVVPADAPYPKLVARCKEVRTILKNEGLVPEFIAPRLWEDPRTIDGAYTANDPRCRAYAWERTKRSIDIANQIGCKLIVLWLAREGTYIRESKDPVVSVRRIGEVLDKMLAYDKRIRIAGEMKPNEPMDFAYLPTVGHFMGMVYTTRDPKRVGVLIESAHSMLAGLDPGDDMAYALAHKKLYSVHLNDQDGLKFDEDKSFGSVNLRRALHTVTVLDRNGYGQNGEFVGLDVKALRTQPRELSTAHLTNSRTVFLKLLEVSRSIDWNRVEQYRATRDYEGLDLYILSHLLNR